YTVKNNDNVTVPHGTGQRNTTGAFWDELDSTKPGQFADDPDKNRNTMFIAADDYVVGTVRHLSDGGSLEGSQHFSDVHPNFLDELFAQRLGIETGAGRVAMNLSSARLNAVKLDGMYRLAKMPDKDQI